MAEFLYPLGNAVMLVGVSFFKNLACAYGLRNRQPCHENTFDHNLPTGVTAFRISRVQELASTELLQRSLLNFIQNPNMYMVGQISSHWIRGEFSMRSRYPIVYNLGLDDRRAVLSFPKSKISRSRPWRHWLRTCRFWRMHALAIRAQRRSAVGRLSVSKSLLLRLVRQSLRYYRYPRTARVG